MSFWNLLTSSVDGETYHYRLESWWETFQYGKPSRTKSTGFYCSNSLWPQFLWVSDKSSYRWDQASVRANKIAAECWLVSFCGLGGKIWFDKKLTLGAAQLFGRVEVSRIGEELKIEEKGDRSTSLLDLEGVSKNVTHHLLKCSST